MYYTEEMISEFLVYKDIPWRDFKTYCAAYRKGFDDAIGQASQHVVEWAAPMDSMHESAIKDILNEVAVSIQEIELT